MHAQYLAIRVLVLVPLINLVDMDGYSTRDKDNIRRTMNQKLTNPVYYSYRNNSFQYLKRLEPGIFQSRKRHFSRAELHHRQTDRQKDKTTFQLSYQNKSSSQCQQDVRKIERQADRQTNRQKDRQIDSQTGTYTTVRQSDRLRGRMTVWQQQGS